MTWTDCATSREYLSHGIIASSGFYIGTVGFLLVWSALGAANTGAYVGLGLFSIVVALSNYKYYSGVTSYFAPSSSSSSPLLSILHPAIRRGTTIFSHFPHCFASEFLINTRCSYTSYI